MNVHKNLHTQELQRQSETDLRLLTGQPTHVFWINFNGIIAKLCLSNSFEVVTADRKVTVTFYPPATNNASHLYTSNTGNFTFYAHATNNLSYLHI